MINFRCIIASIVLLLPAFSNTLAHEIRPALVNLTQSSAKEWTLNFKQPQVQGRFLNLAVTTNCTHTDGESVLGNNALLTTEFLNCTDGELALIAIYGIEKTLIDAMVTLETIDGEKANHLITARNPKLELTQATAIPAYLVMGVEHLVFGIDHVLFVLLLLYLIKGWRNLIKVVTSFTVAHSISLGLSAFNLVSVSQSPVEALIALSIVVLALEAFRPKTSLLRSYPWVITFVFGLLHGLGFAGALNTIGLPESNLVGALFLFNVGIEIGQLGIILVAMVTVSLIHRTPLIVTSQVIRLPIYLIGGVAMFWFFERSLPLL